MLYKNIKRLKVSSISLETYLFLCGKIHMQFKCDVQAGCCKPIATSRVNGRAYYTSILEDVCYSSQFPSAPYVSLVVVKLPQRSSRSIVDKP